MGFVASSLSQSIHDDQMCDISGWIEVFDFIIILLSFCSDAA